ncbi:hypothetical protein [Paenibacillus sp.]|uniref:hypothetical protein n=1 Tax=Paenibacillus sp. TaxID=58172 RepID=UPI0028109E8D|nr:hypothetical protein [Paenibacillus sp.]
MTRSGSGLRRGTACDPKRVRCACGARRGDPERVKCACGARRGDPERVRAASRRGGRPNLKDGVRTDYGIVSVKRHTELELRFTDPATNELHPGVANTIAKGHNLMVEFPAYSDYRHIPVIGKGVTFQLPHCPDVWGMMCEGDLEEVYRIRGLSWNVKRMQVWFVFGLVLLNYGLFWLLRFVPWLPGELYAAANLV